jgi:tetratricopeptide (TPR) repeat protein
MDNKQYDAAIESFNKAGNWTPSRAPCGPVWRRLTERAPRPRRAPTRTPTCMKAAETWTKAIEINPEEAGLHNNYALVLAQCKKFPEAQAELEKGRYAQPGRRGQYYYNLGALEVNAGQNDAANETFKKAIAITPPYAEAFYQYGLTLLAKATLDKDGKTIPSPEPPKLSRSIWN